MDCQRIVCLSRGMAPELVQLQHDCERVGARFHIVSNAQALAALVTANDEVVVIADGLLPPLDAATTLLDGPHAVLVQPIETGLAAGFERIDLSHASAGLMRVPGRLVERLHELPADCDVPSALTRIALQAGVAQRPLPPEAHDGLRWPLVRNEGEAHAAEAGWISLHLNADGPLTPGSGAARLAVRNFGPAILHAGSGGNAAAIGATVVIVLALGLGWIDFAVSALLLWALAWIIRRAAAMLIAVERESLALGPAKWSREPLFGWVHDAALIAILMWNSAPHPASSVWERGFAPLILICLLRLGPRLYSEAWSAWLADRSLLGLLLAALAGAGYLAQGLPVLAAVLAIMAVIWPAAHLRLTRV